MRTLYELNENYSKVLDMLYDEEIDEQTVIDTLEAIEGEIECKADGYAKIIKELEAKIKGMQEEARRLNDSAAVLGRRAGRLKSSLSDSMKLMGKTGFTTDLFNFSIVKNGGKQRMTIDGDVPEEYKKIITEPDAEKIRRILENGDNLAFAHLEPRGEHLRIK